MRNCLKIFLLSCFLCSTAHAQQTLLIGVEDHDYLPYYNFQSQQVVGFFPELINQFAAEYGYQIEYRALPVARLFHDFVGGRVDFKLPANPAWSQSMKVGKNIIYSDPLVRYIDGVMVLPGRKGRLIDDFKTLGTILGFTVSNPIWNQRIERGAAHKLEARHYLNLIRMTKSGYIDGVYANIEVGYHQLKQFEKPNTLIFDDTLPYADDFYHLSTIKYPKVIEQFDKFLQNHSSNIETLRTKHGIGIHLPTPTKIQ